MKPKTIAIKTVFYDFHLYQRNQIYRNKIPMFKTKILHLFANENKANA